MIKKSSLKEYDVNYSSYQAYKFKYENDEVIAVNIQENTNKEIIIVSKKGMAIRFTSDNVNAMGRIASGVTGISLKEDDEAISGIIINELNVNQDEISVDSDNDMEITLTTKNKDKKKILIKDIRVQNRAGRGTNVMVINLDDEIIETQYS